MNTIPTTFKSIDIHAHILHSLDHGADNLNASIKLLEEAKKYHIENIFCTPHYRYNNDNYEQIFSEVNKHARKLGIKLYKGNELLLTDSLINELETKQINTLNNTKYILIELRRNTIYSIKELVKSLQEILNLGYKIIIVHPELYHKTLTKTKELIMLKKMGILFQIDAQSFYQDRKFRHKINKLIKLDLVSFVASDIHAEFRDYETYYKFYCHLVTKYNKEYANKLYYNNAKKIFKIN